MSKMVRWYSSLSGLRMRIDAMRDFVISLSLLAWLRPGGLPRVMTRLFLLLLVIPLSFSVGVEVPYVEAAHASGDPSVVGHWEAPITTPVVGTHSIVLPTGKIYYLISGAQRRSGTRQRQALPRSQRQTRSSARDTAHSPTEPRW